MNQEQRDEQKKLGIKRFFKSFTYSWAGLTYAFPYEHSMLVPVLVTLLVIFVGNVVKLTLAEWIIVLLLIGLVISTELVNTAIEAVVDLSCPEIDPLAKVAKDTASAAVFIFATVAFICGLILFVPNIIDYIQSLM